MVMSVVVSLLVLPLLAADTSSGSGSGSGGRRWKREEDTELLGAGPWLFLSITIIKHTWATSCQYNFIYTDKLSSFSSSYESKIGNASILRINNRRWIAADRAGPRAVTRRDPRPCSTRHHHPLHHRHVLESYQDLQGGIRPHRARVPQVQMSCRGLHNDHSLHYVHFKQSLEFNQKIDNLSHQIVEIN